VFKLLQVMDAGGHATRYGEPTRQRLDIAVLNFFQSFRKVYIGEQVRRGGWGEGMSLEALIIEREADGGYPLRFSAVAANRGTPHTQPHLTATPAPLPPLPKPTQNPI